LREVDFRDGEPFAPEPLDEAVRPGAGEKAEFPARGFEDAVMETRGKESIRLSIAEESVASQPHHPAALGADPEIAVPVLGQPVDRYLAQAIGGGVVPEEPALFRRRGKFAESPGCADPDLAVGSLKDRSDIVGGKPVGR